MRKTKYYNLFFHSNVPFSFVNKIGQPIDKFINELAHLFTKIFIANLKDLQTIILANPIIDMGQNEMLANKSMLKVKKH